jgi:PKD repeat protein
MVTVAAHNAGLGTSFFRTDLRALSLTDEPATVFAEWYPHGVTNATGPATLKQFVIPAGGQAVYDDVVSSLFGAATRGAIRLLSTFPFVETARNYNDQRSTGGGTFGEDNAGLGVNGALTSGAMILNSNQPQTSGLGLRTNVGYFNPSPYPIDVTFNVRIPDGTLVAPPSKTTLPPWSDDQAVFYSFIPGIPGDQNTLTNFAITFTSTMPIYLFSSVADNVTSDGIHQAPVPVPAALTQPVASTQPLPPTGTITVPAGNTTATMGAAVSFVGTGTDPQGEALTVSWNFGDGGSGSGYSASHSYASTGTFTVTLMVTNTDGLSDPNPPTRQITVTQAPASGPPTGTITEPATSTSAYTGYAVSFIGTGTDPQGETLTGTWSFGDGGTATGFSTSHTFSYAGRYTVTFTVKNTDGLSDPNPPTRQITVTDYGYGY